MPSLISDAEKANLTGIFADIFDTFSRPIVVYKKPQKVTTLVNTAFIFGYEAGTWNEAYTYTYQSGEFDAVINYSKGLKEHSDDDVGAGQPVVGGTIKVKKEAADYIEAGRPNMRTLIDDKNFSIVGQARLQAFLNSKFYIFNIESLK